MNVQSRFGTVAGGGPPPRQRERHRSPRARPRRRPWEIVPPSAAQIPARSHEPPRVGDRAALIAGHAALVSTGAVAPSSTRRRSRGTLQLSAGSADYWGVALRRLHLLRSFPPTAAKVADEGAGFDF